MRIALLLVSCASLVLAGCSSSPLSQARDLKEVADKEVRSGIDAAVADNYPLALERFDSATTKYQQLGLTYGVRGELARIRAHRAHVLRATGKCNLAGTELASAVQTILTDNSVDISDSALLRKYEAEGIILGKFSTKSPPCSDVGAPDFREVGRQALTRYSGQAENAARQTALANQRNEAKDEAARAAARRERAEMTAAITGAAAAVQQGAYRAPPSQGGVSPTGGSNKVWWGQNTQCARLAGLHRDGNAQWFSFTNQCSMPIFVRYAPQGQGFSRAELKPGEVSKSWHLTQYGPNISYVACAQRAPGGESVSIDSTTNQCYYYRRN
jgi:hypothetical protein